MVKILIIKREKQVIHNDIDKLSIPIIWVGQRFLELNRFSNELY